VIDQMKKWIVPMLLLVAACGEVSAPPKCNSQPLNPNGDSELALLMRSMFDDGMRIKAQVERGEQPTGLADFSAIHTAMATDSMTHAAEFTAFADAYLASVKQLEASDSNAVFRFNRMVDQCMNCHTSNCPGAKKRIQKLYITE